VDSGKPHSLYNLRHTPNVTSCPFLAIVLVNEPPSTSFFSILARSKPASTTQSSKFPHSQFSATQQVFYITRYTFKTHLQFLNHLRTSSTFRNVITRFGLNFIFPSYLNYLLSQLLLQAFLIVGLCGSSSYICPCYYSPSYTIPCHILVIRQGRANFHAVTA
jgi:hypothetical protein